MKKQLTGGEAVVKYLVCVLKWVALEGSQTLSSRQEETIKETDEFKSLPIQA